MLFLLTAQILSAILNKVLSLNLVPGFNSNLSRDFNHLMFVDDLILVTKASRKTAKNFLLCPNLYQNLTGEKPNLHKSIIFLPSWCNSKVAKVIYRILGIKLGQFPFTYLGAPISPRKLLVSQLNFPPNRVKSIIHTWNHSTILTVGHTILLNITIFAIPNYLLFDMNLPNAILDYISKLARDFLWGRIGNSSGFH